MMGGVQVLINHVVVLNLQFTEWSELQLGQLPFLENIKCTFICFFKLKLHFKIGVEMNM